MSGSLEQALETVSDEATFLRFVKALAADFEAETHEEATRGRTNRLGRGARGWENSAVDTFLEAAIAWAEDSRGTQPVSSNPWRRCADILYAGKGYE
jgi:hypothetical protein